MPRFRIIEAVSLRRVKKPQFLHCAATLIFSDFFCEPSPSPASLHLLRRPAPPSRTTPTVLHTSDAPGQHFVACTAPSFSDDQRSSTPPSRTSPTVLHTSDAQLPPSRTPPTLQAIVSSPAPHRRSFFFFFFDQPPPSLHRRGAVHCHRSRCVFFEQPSPTVTVILFNLHATARTSRRFFRCRCHCLHSIPRSLVCLFLRFRLFLGSPGFNFFGLFVCSYIFNLEFEIIKSMEDILDCLY